MAKKLNITKLAKMENALARFSKTFNQLLNRPLDDLVTYYQVWCEDEEVPIGNATTDLNIAKRIRKDHRDETGHIAKIIPDHQTNES